MKKKKNENFVDVDDVDVRGGPTVGGLIGPPPLWGDFDVGDLPRWTVSVSDFAVWGCLHSVGGPIISVTSGRPRKRNFVDVDGENAPKPKKY